jgi:hypothetical protein
MNGTEETNMGNKNIDQRITIKKNSKEHKIISKNNLLLGTTFYDLKKYVDLIH